MLHDETLSLLRYFSSQTYNGVLEIGSYIGGSTIALGDGRRGRAKGVISIEPGGQYLNHPHLPSSNILDDLKNNIKRFNLENEILLLEGTSYNKENIKIVDELFGSNGIDLLFIDADGEVGRDINNFFSILNDQCILILDDYCSPGAPEKEMVVKKWVDEQKETNQVTELGVVLWGTWVGKLNKTKNRNPKNL